MYSRNQNKINEVKWFKKILRKNSFWFKMMKNITPPSKKGSMLNCPFIIVYFSPLIQFNLFLFIFTSCWCHIHLKKKYIIQIYDPTIWKFFILFHYFPFFLHLLCGYVLHIKKKSYKLLCIWWLEWIFNNSEKLFVKKFQHGGSTEIPLISLNELKSLHK